MIARIQRLWRTKPILLLALTMSVLAFAFFGVQTAAKAVYWLDPAHKNQPLEGWMTPRYVSHSYGIPPEILFPAFGLEHKPKGSEEDRREGRMKLSEIAAANNLTLAELQEKVETLAQQVDADKEGRKDD